MFICVLKISIHIPWTQSLKNKRSEVTSIIEKIQNKFNASFIEYDMQSKYQIAYLGIAFLVSKIKQSNKYFTEIMKFINSISECEISILSFEVI